MSKAIYIQVRDAMQGAEKLLRAAGFCMEGSATTPYMKAINALTEAIDAPEKEPMFWVRLCSDESYEGPIHNSGIERVRKLSGVWSPLYLHQPPVREPLTQPDKQRLWNDACYNNKSSTTDAAMEYGTMIEAAHGIKP